MKIAVVGGGISGLSAALLLQEKHEVHLFESEPRLGGHAHTVEIPAGGSAQVAVDTGFLVYNTLTYPHFTRFLDYLGVQSAESNMSLSIQNQQGTEWAGENLRSVFAQKRNLFSISFLRMLLEILRFNRQAEENLKLSKERQWTLQDLVTFRKCSTDFQTLYLLPMTGAIWSSSYAQALNFPAETFLTFCINHRLLQVNQRPVWRTVLGGSINYVKKVQERLAHVHLSAPIQSLRKHEGKLILTTPTGDHEFDKVVFATHAPTTQKILRQNFPELSAALAPLKVSTNKVELHTDESVMPRKKICWSAWNVRARQRPDDSQDICLTYYLNKLQPLKTQWNHFVTLNSTSEIKKVDRVFSYDHPQFDFPAIQLQQRLPALQGQENIFFAGAWTRYGFHEDGILSAVTVAKLLGVEPPWV